MSSTRSQLDGSHAPPNIEYIPPELQLPILLNLESYESLYNIIRASPVLFQVFRDQRMHILLVVGQNGYESQVLPDIFAAAAVVRGRPQLPKLHSRTYCNTYLAEKVAKSHFAQEAVLILDPYWRPYDRKSSVAQENLLWNLHLFDLCGTLDYFVQDFTQHRLRRFKTYTQDPFISADSGFCKATNLDLMPLSATENNRLQRAFCRFEIFARCFQPLPHHTCLITAYERRLMFFDHFGIQEVEEIVCIRDYFFTRLANMFEAVEDECIQRQANDDHKDHDSMFRSLEGVKKH